MRRETAEKYKKICKLLQAGKSRKEIAEEVSCCASTIDDAIRRFGKEMKCDSFVNYETEIAKMWQAEEPEEQEPVPKQYADNTKRSKTIIIRGKVYQDVSAWYM